MIAEQQEARVGLLQTLKGLGVSSAQVQELEEKLRNLMVSEGDRRLHELRKNQTESQGRLRLCLLEPNEV